MPGHGNRAHAILAASSSHRWLKCTPSARAEVNETGSSSYADEGTHAHEWLGNELRYIVLETINETRYRDIQDSLADDQYHSQEVIEGAESFIDFLQTKIDPFNLMGGPPVTMHSEEKLDFSSWVPEGFGTGDFLALEPTVLHVFDYKFGKGVKVLARENSQLMLYGLGGLTFHKKAAKGVKEVHLHIVQPRLNHFDTFVITKVDLLNWANKTCKPKAKLAFEGQGKFVPGDHCRFCKIKHNCEALASESLRLAGVEMNSLDDESIIEFYEKVDMVLSWANALKTYVNDQAVAGKVWPGYKLVAGKANRKVTDIPKAIKALSAAGYRPGQFISTKLEGITALEKLLGKKGFTELLGKYVDKPIGAPTLVPESDSRPVYSYTTAEQDFKE